MDIVKDANNKMRENFLRILKPNRAVIQKITMNSKVSFLLPTIYFLCFLVYDETTFCILNMKSC